MAAFPVDATIAKGVAKPSAQGQAMTKTFMAKIKDIGSPAMAHKTR